MNEQKIYTRDDLINNVDEYIKQIEQHTNQRQVEGINQIQHISNNTDTFTRSENQPQNVLFNQQNMLQFVNPPTVSQGQSEGYQTECPVLNNPMIINGLTQQIVQIIDPIAITVVPQDDQTLYTVSFLYPNNTVKTAQNVKFSDPNTGESIIVAPGTYNIYCSEGQVYFLNVQKLQIPIEPASTSTIYNNPVNNIDTRNTFLNAQRTNEFNGQNMGQYYNSNQNNFMNYNNHQGF